MPWLFLIIPILILFTVMLVRAVRFTPLPASQGTGDELTDFRAEAAGGHLSQMIQMQTVSSRKEDEIDHSAFDAFMALLPELYPEAHKVLTRETVNRHALLYHWAGRSKEKPVVLMAHYDVVSAREDNWKHPPFAGEIEDGIIWGRGAVDTKITLASIMEAAEFLIKDGFTPEHDIYLSFSNNEEIAGDSTPAIVALFEERGIDLNFVLDEGGAVVTKVFPGVTSPVALVGVAEKGIVDVDLVVNSAGGHASSPPKVTAPVTLARLIISLNRHPFHARFPAPTIEMLHILGRHTPFAYRIIFANLWLFGPLLLAVFANAGGEMNAIVRTTVAVTMLEGSRGSNVLASRAKASANIRVAVGESVGNTVEHIRRISAKEGALVNTVYATEPSPVSRTAGAPYELLGSVIHRTFPEAILSPYVMLGGSDSRHFARISPYVYRFSPMELTKAERNSMHAANEAIPVKKLDTCIAFYIRLIRSI